MSAHLKSQALIRKDGDNFNNADGSCLDGKVVALYFSAHWCPPCRQFTPILKDFYDEAGGDLEIVFVSFDRTEDDLKSYMKEAHGDWLAVPFGDAAIQELAKKYGVQGIPALVVVKPDGNAVVENARTDVQGKSKSPKQTVDEWKTKTGQS